MFVLLACSSEFSDPNGRGAVCCEWRPESHLHHFLHPDFHVHCGAVHPHVLSLMGLRNAGQHFKGQQAKQAKHLSLCHPAAVKPCCTMLGSISKVSRQSICCCTACVTLSFCNCKQASQGSPISVLAKHACYAILLFRYLAVICL